MFINVTGLFYIIATANQTLEAWVTDMILYTYGINIQYHF